MALLLAYNVFMVGYFVAANAVYTLLLVLGWRESSEYVRRRRLTDYADIARSELTTPMSILVPAYNEAPVIADAVRALLAANYPLHEVIVVNDGSRDDTLAALMEAFSLVQVRRVPRAGLATAEIRGVYACPEDSRLVVIDKANGGKADAINCGLNYARYPIFCTIDSDTIIDDDALLRLVRPFQADPTLVACGGVVRIANGSTIENGRVTAVHTPSRLIENIQIVEYLRAFLAGRTGWSRLGALLVISGAFGVFRREVVIAAGGYDTSTVGEDAELVVRLHRHCRDAAIPYRVTFLADPVCWTEAPSSRTALASQRSRWHRGLVEVLIKHRGMIGRPRYGVVGLVGLPYYVLFEALGPILELAGYVVSIVALVLGAIDASFALMLFGLALTYGLILSFGALLIEDRAYRRYRSWRCVARMVIAAVVENFGYRQWHTVVRVAALWAMMRGRNGWGEMTRVGFDPAAQPAPLVRAPRAATSRGLALVGAAVALASGLLAVGVLQRARGHESQAVAGRIQPTVAHAPSARRRGPQPVAVTAASDGYPSSSPAVDTPAVPSALGPAMEGSASDRVPTPAAAQAAKPADHAPRAGAYAAKGIRGKVLNLRYQVTDDKGRTREIVIIWAPSGRLIKRIRTRMSRSLPGRIYVVQWMLPLRLPPGLGAWCVDAYDPEGGRVRSCAGLRVRPGSASRSWPTE